MRNLRRPIGGRTGDMLNKMNVTLMMILLAFFIVLNTLSVPSSDKRKAALGSLVGTLGILPGGQSPMQQEKKSVSKSSAPMLSDRISAAKLIGEFEEYAIRKKIGRKVATIVTSNGLELTLESSIVFGRNSAKIRPSASSLLEKIGNVLERVNGPFVIEGHTDDRKVETARYPSAIDLSIGRAGAIARFFINRTNVKPSNIAIAGFGPHRPLFPNDTPERRERNDRIRIVYKRVT